MTSDVMARADANFVIHATWAAARTAGMTCQVRDDLVIADSGLPCDTFNFICRARLDRATARQAATAAVAYFAKVKRPFSWWVGPADSPEELGAILEGVGLSRAETELAMALSLDHLPDSVSIEPAVEVRRVRSAADLHAMAEIAAGNWTPPDANVLEFYRRTAPVILDSAAPQWFYLGLLNGRPVATAEATIHEGTVGLYNIATRPAFRGRGIGSVMTWQPLRDARAVGCDLAVLQAAEQGIGLYRRLGFAEFGEITEFKPPGQ